MLWLVWRQHRMQALITSVLLLAFGGVLLIHGMGTANLTAGLAPGSEELNQVLGERFQGMYMFINWLPLVPALVGLFWGAPVLAREFEAGTAKLAWTQSVSPRRWLTTKLAGLGLMVTLGGLALGAIVNGWLATFDGSPHGNRFSLVPLFGGSGVAAAGWWLFTFVVGVAAGTVFRRMLPAMAVTFAVYVVAFVVVASPIVDFRDMYAEPVRTVVTGEDVATGETSLRGSMTEDLQWLDPQGQELTAGAVEAATGSLCADRGERFDYSPCLFENGYQQAVYNYPPSMYWRFQWTEAAILLAGALALGGYVVWRTARRRV